MYQDQVFCFTPKGDLISLPRGATPIDFAYTVHTDVGNSRVGAKVNGVHVPLHTPLQQWRSGRDHPHEGTDAVAALGAVRRHRSRARRNPPLSAPCPARRACEVRPQDSGKGLRRRRPGTDGQGHRGGAPRNCVSPKPTTSMPKWAAARCAPMRCSRPYSRNSSAIRTAQAGQPLSNRARTRQFPFAA